MSSRKITVTVSLISTLMILGYYLLNLIPMFQQDEMNSEEVFRLAGIVVVATIVLNIVGNIIAMISVNIVHAIQTQSDKEVRLVDDERDKLIELKGTRVSYVASSFGVLAAMLTFVFGQPPLVMFSLIILFGLVAGILGDLSQFYFDHKGA